MTEEHPIIVWAETWRRELALLSGPGWTIDRSVHGVEDSLLWKAVVILPSEPGMSWQSAIGIEHEELRAIQAPQSWGEPVQVDERMVRELLVERLQQAIYSLEREGLEIPADLLEAAGVAPMAQAEEATDGE